MPHAGWGAQTHVHPEGIETDLWSTVLVLEDGRARAAIVDLDLVTISTQESQAIAAEVAGILGIARDAVRVSVTHNHTGPPPSRSDWRGGTEALQRYYRSLPEFSAGAARIALANLRPARIAIGSGQSRVAVNRREDAPGGRIATGVNFGGTIDPEVFVLRIDDTDAAPLAAIVGYTMHPTTAGPTFRRITADWPGHLKRTVERLTGATCVFAQGATGNVGPGPEGYTDDAEVVRRLGALVGYEASRVHLALRVPAVEFVHERIWESGAPLGKWTSRPAASPEPAVRTRAVQLTLPLREQPAPAEAEARAYHGRTEHAVTLHMLRIGPAVLAGIPCEPFAEIALAIKAKSPFPHTWFGGYTGGWAGYIPIASEYRRGGYEVDTTPFAPEAADRVVEGTLAALREFYDAP